MLLRATRISSLKQQRQAAQTSEGQRASGCATCSQLDERINKVSCRFRCRRQFCRPTNFRCATSPQQSSSSCCLVYDYCFSRNAHVAAQKATNQPLALHECLGASKRQLLAMLNWALLVRLRHARVCFQRNQQLNLHSSFGLVAFCSLLFDCLQVEGESSIRARARRTAN